MTEVEEFISTIENTVKRQDALEILSLLEDISGNNAYLNGSIIGFGRYHYKYESGLEGDSAIIAFSPRKQNTVIYIMPGFSKYTDLLALLGRHKLGKSCLYINKLADINTQILRQIASLSIREMKDNYECENT
jgi:hypothetical protein